MKKVILGLAVSLDGYIEGPKGEYDWCFTDQDYGLSAFFKSIDTIFMGRKSYELASKTEAENPWKGITTYVFSNSLKQVSGQDVKLMTGDVKKQVNELRNGSGKDIWLFGGGELIATFMKEDWIDEYWLSIHPILLGSGKPCFGYLPDRVGLELVECKPYETGLVSVRYRRIRP